MKQVILTTGLLIVGQTFGQGVIQSKVNQNKLILINKKNSIEKLLSKPSSQAWKVGANKISAEFSTVSGENLNGNIQNPAKHELEDLNMYINLGVYFKSALEKQSLTQEEKHLLQENFEIECLTTDQGDQCLDATVKPNFCKVDKESVKKCLEAKLKDFSFPSHMVNMPKGSGLDFVNRKWWGANVEEYGNLKVTAKYAKEDCKATVTSLVDFDALADENYQSIPCSYVSTFKQIGAFLTDTKEKDFSEAYSILMDLNSMKEDKVKELNLLGVQNERFKGNQYRNSAGHTSESAATMDTFMFLDIRKNEKRPETITYKHELVEFSVSEAKKSSINETLSAMKPLTDGMTGLEIIKATLTNLKETQNLLAKVPNVKGTESMKNTILEKLFNNEALNKASLSENLSIRNGDITAKEKPFTIERKLKVVK